MSWNVPPAGGYQITPPPGAPGAPPGGQGYGYPPQQGYPQAYPPQQAYPQAYPPQQGYPPAYGGAPPPAGGAYPPPGGYPPAPGGYGAPPPAGAYPPAGGAYPPPGGQHPPYPQQAHGHSPYGAAVPHAAHGGYGYGAPPGGHHVVPGNGRRKAVIIGINYAGQGRGELKGCINDARNMRQFLTERYRFPDDQVMVLTDDTHNAQLRPTKMNIMNAIRWLVTGAMPGDVLFFHFSGHGGQVRDTSGDEADGMDETILPLDYHQAGQIVDDDLYAQMIAVLPEGVCFFSVMDCCHSGTGLDLPYEYDVKGGSKVKQKKQKKMKQPKADKKQKADKKNKAGKGKKGGSSVQPCRAHAVLFSGCADHQTSADTHVGGVGATGAMTYAFMTTLRKNPHQTYGQILQSMRTELNSGPRKYTQVPQLTSGRPLDLNAQFLM